jgi:hypothetical protein
LLTTEQLQEMVIQAALLGRTTAVQSLIVLMQVRFLALKAQDQPAVLLDMQTGLRLN